MRRVFFLFLLFPVAAGAQNAALKTPAPAKITLAREFTLTYTLTPPPGYTEVKLDEESLNKKDFEVTPQPCVTVGSALECSFKLTPFALNETTFSGPRWLFAPAGAAKAEDIELNISPAIKLSLKKDIKEIRGHYFPWNLWKILIITCVLMLLIFLLLTIRKKKSASGAVRETEAPALPIEILSKNQIQHLLESGVWEAGEYKKFYFSLTDIFRNYLHKRFNLSAEYQTSAELLRAIKKSPAAPILTPARALLTSADLVKFARLTPQNTRRDADIKNIYAMIDQTTPEEKHDSVS